MKVSEKKKIMEKHGFKKSHELKEKKIFEYFQENVMEIFTLTFLFRLRFQKTSSFHCSVLLKIKDPEKSLSFMYSKNKLSPNGM